MTSYSSASGNHLFDNRAIALGFACIVAATAFVAYTSAVLVAIVIGVILLALRWLIPARLELWQALMITSVAGFMILNYGFENLIVARIGGVPLLIGEFLMLAGLLLAIHQQGFNSVKPLARDPAVRCFILLFILAVCHLAVDVPRYGLYAVRDASLYFEAIFLAAGYLWASHKNGIRRFLQCLLVVFALNVLYSFTLPVSESLQAASPKSGVFQPIALFGQYQQIGLYLVAGAMLCTWLADYTTKGSRWILFTLALAQLCGLAVTQNRSMYLGIVIIFAALFILRERRKLRRFAAIVGAGVVAMVTLLVAFTFLGITIRGRVGEINADFLQEYALSVLSVDNSNSRLAQDDDRVDWLRQTWQNTASDPATLLVGQGFGLPLIEFETENGVPVRQPHNAAMGVFGRLGVAGLCTWLLFQLILFKRFIKALRTNQPRESHDLVLWLLVFYILAFVMSMVQPALEFSHFAVPLYFVVGFALKVLDNTLQTSRANLPIPLVSR